MCIRFLLRFINEVERREFYYLFTEVIIEVKFSSVFVVLNSFASSFDVCLLLLQLTRMIRLIEDFPELYLDRFHQDVERVVGDRDVFCVQCQVALIRPTDHSPFLIKVPEFHSNPRNLIRFQNCIHLTHRLMMTRKLDHLVHRNLSFAAFQLSN